MIRLPIPLRLKLKLDNAKVQPCYYIETYMEYFRVKMQPDEKEVLTRFLGLITPNEIIYDIGANIGLYSIPSASLLKTGRLHAFEPDPETAMRLHGNIQLNKLSNVIVHTIAIGNCNQIVPLYSNGIRGKSPTLEKIPGTKVVDVQMRTLDDLIMREQMEIPSIIKVDIEGGEIHFLLGAGNTLGGVFGPPPRLVLMEIHKKELERFGSSDDKVILLMKTLGYEATTIFKGAFKRSHCFFMRHCDS